MADAEETAVLTGDSQNNKYDTIDIASGEYSFDGADICGLKKNAWLKVFVYGFIFTTVISAFLIVYLRFGTGTAGDQVKLVLYQNTLSPYPGYDGDIQVSGSWTLNFNTNEVTITYKNIEGDERCINGTNGQENSCAIQVMDGFTCEDPNAEMSPFWNSEDEELDSDPWATSVYTPGDGEMYVYFGYSWDAVEGRTFVVHDLNGTRVSCEYLYPTDYADLYVVDTYPGYTGNVHITGNVTMLFQNTQVIINYLLFDIQMGCMNGPANGTANSCGIHIHEGESCETDEEVGGHFYDTELDPWTYDASYTGSEGRLIVEYGYTWEEAQGRTVVVHDLTGRRVTCTVLPLKPQ